MPVGAKSIRRAASKNSELTGEKKAVSSVETKDQKEAVVKKQVNKPETKTDKPVSKSGVKKVPQKKAQTTVKEVKEETSTSKTTYLVGDELPIYLM